MKYEPGVALPISYNTDFDLMTDESFSRIFFYSIGAGFIAEQKHVARSEYGPFLVDLPLHDLKMRNEDKFRPLGVRIHFSREQMVTAIHDYAKNITYCPGEDGWDEAKYLARCSVFTTVTFRNHITWTVSLTFAN